MGKVVYKGFYKKAVFDVDAFVPADRDFKFMIMKYITLMFEFVAPDIAFIKYRVSCLDFP